MSMRRLGEGADSVRGTSSVPGSTSVVHRLRQGGGASASPVPVTGY